MKRAFNYIVVVIAIGVVLGAMLAAAFFVPTYSPELPGTETPTDGTKLRFREGSFKIVQFSDFHEWLGIEHDSNGLAIEEKDDLKPLLKNYIASVLDAEKPDLVVLTGDNAFSLSLFYDLGRKITLKTYAAIAAVFEERRQPWTLTFGNHDSEGLYNKSDLFAVLTQYRYFIGALSDTDEILAYSDGIGTDDERIGNYAIPVYDGDRTAFAVYLLDSGSYNSSQAAKDKPYRYITAAQTAWFRSASERLAQNGQPVPALMFTHIPLWEHIEAVEQGNESIGHPYGFSPSDTRSPIFEAVVETGGVKGIFVGHNHSNSVATFYRRPGVEIMMGVTPQAAAASYDDTTSILYSRIFTVTADGSVTTRLHTSENGGGIYLGQSLTIA